MKKLLTLALALCVGVSAFAQFAEGDDVTKELGVKAADSGSDEEVKTATNEGSVWKGFDYTQSEKKNDNDYPKYEYLSYDFHTWGIYGVDTWDVYQDIDNVPAGIYTMSLEALYRGGQLGTVIAKYDAGMPVKNTKIYVQIGDQVFEEYVKDICVGRFKGQTAEDGTTTGLYVASDGNWGSDEKQGNWYYPVSHGGFSAYLDAQCDGVSYDNQGKISMYHNSIQFIVPTDGTTVRIGIKHETPIAEDSSAWDHWRIFYDYAYDEEGLAKVAYAKYEKVWNAMDAFYQETLENYPALGELIGDDLMEIEQSVVEDDAKSIYAAIDALNAVEAKYLEALITIKSMDYLVAVSQSLIDCENRYEECDKEALKTAIENAETAINASLGEAGIESIDDYITAAKALYKARVDYIWSGEEHTGADGTAWRDVSGIVACSGLVNEKYTPYYDAETGEYRYPQEIEDSWTMYHPNDGANTEIETGYINNRIKVEDYPELEGKMMPALANEAKWSYDVTDVNRWVYDGTSFKGAVTPAATTYMWYKGYSAHYGGWTANPNEGELRFFQTITDLPEGYYSVEGRMISNKGQGSADDIKQYLFIQGVNEDGTVDEESKYEKQNATNWSSYTRQDWEIGETDMIRLSAGQNLVIGYSQNCEAADGGVILKFYGTDVNFPQLTEEAKQKVVSLLEQNEDNFKLLGDKPAVEALLAQVTPASVSDDPGFKAAKAILAEATDFIKAAAAYNFNTQADYLALQAQYTSQKEASILAVAATYVDALAENATSTYKDGQAADAMYKAYASYMKTFDQAEKLATEEINGILANQAANLTNYCDDASVLAQYELDLKNPIYKAIFANLHTEEATEANPVEITVVLANPSFTEGVDGWDGTKPSQNEYANGNAEIWNQTTVDMYQKFQGLPAGKYKVTAQALYRDGAGSAGLATCYKNWQAANGDKEAWNAVNNYNAVLYAKSGRYEGKDLINSVCDTKETGISFDTFYVIEDKGYPNDGKFLLYNQITEEDLPYAEDYATKYVLENEDGTKGDAFQYPFDGRVDLEDGTSLFFPESMAGAALRFAQDEYKVAASVNVLPGEDLQLGIRKDAGTNGDWIIFDNFQLWYLGPIDESTPEPNPSANLIADEESYNFNKAEAKIEEVWGNKQYHVGSWAMTWNNNDGKATVDLVEPGYNKSAKALKLSNPEAGKFVYSAQLENSTLASPLLKGHNYVAKFYAKADAEGTEFQFSAEAAWEANVSKYQFGETVSLTTDWKEYTINICVPDGTEDGADASLAYEDLTAVKFNFGFMTGTAYVDRVLVYDAREEINPDGNFIVDDESFAFNGGTLGEWKPSQWNTNNGKATAAVAQPGWNNSNACIAVKNTEKNGQGLYYQGQTQYVLPQALEMGKHYTATFYAKADEGFEGEFQFSAEATWAPNVTKYQYTENFTDISEDWTLYTIDFEVPTKAEGFTCEDLTTISLNYGMMVGQVYIDHIVILETPAPEINPDDNMIADEASFGFEDGTVGQWHYLGWNNAGTFANAAPGYGSEGSMVLTSNNSAGDPWSAQLLCPLKTPVMRGGEYQITFYAKCDAENEGDFINPGIAKAYPEPEWNTAENAVLTKEWQKFTYTLVADESNTAEDGNSNFYFNHGKLTGNAYVDRVTVICTKNPETAINGVEINKASSVRYNLNGQAVGSDYKGTVIEGGKKFIVK